MMTVTSYTSVNCFITLKHYGASQYLQLVQGPVMVDSSVDHWFTLVVINFVHDQIDDIFDQSAQFFALPLESKTRYAHSRSRENDPGNDGYVRLEQEW